MIGRFAFNRFLKKLDPITFLDCFIDNINIQFIIQLGNVLIHYYDGQQID